MAIGLVGVASGGSCGRRDGVLWFYGGWVSSLLERLPVDPFAMTWGHVVLARTQAALDLSWTHELVHVRQYERWGPLTVPAYALCSIWLWLRHRDPYRDNPFEREAYGREDPALEDLQ